MQVTGMHPKDFSFSQTCLKSKLKYPHLRTTWLFLFKQKIENARNKAFQRVSQDHDSFRRISNLKESYTCI